MEVPRDRLDLKENPGLLSPPYIATPYECAKVVNVRGYVTGATIDVEVAGAMVVTGHPGGFPMPDGVVVPLPAALLDDQVVRARQSFGGATSDWSAPVATRRHLEDFPAGLPRPELFPLPLYECGARTGVGNLLVGCNVWITADGALVGRVDNANDPQGVDVDPAYGDSQDVVGWAELCSDPSPPSATARTGPGPTPLPMPTFEPLHEGSQQLTIRDLGHGAHFRLRRNGVDLGVWRTWGERHLVGLSPAFAAGESFACEQWLCPGDPVSPPGNGVVQPCSALRAPVVGPIQNGDSAITVLEFVSDATIKVFVNLVQVGTGSGPVILLPGTQIRDGDTVHVLQQVGSCTSGTVQQVESKCVAPPTTYDPAALNLFPVGYTEYDGGSVSIRGRSFSVKGTVYYPANADGVGTAFHTRLAALGRVPLVLMAHGNHSPADPSHLGYDYFQQALAKMGIVAASVYLNETNGQTGGAGNIRDRADLIIESVKHFQALDAGGDPIFGGRLDFDRLGLMGHSRGGEAVVLVQEMGPPAGVRIRAILSLAPTDWGATMLTPQGTAFMTLLPAADGDVWSNDGAKFYDQARPAPFKSQLYVHYANHNFFNRRWLNDDAYGTLPLMSRSEHEHILLAYGCALYRATLLGHGATGFLSGYQLPAGARAQDVYRAFEWERKLVVDHHEDGNGIGTNSLGAPTAQSSGLTADEYPFAQSGGAFNGSFYGRSTGMVAVNRDADGRFRSQLRKAEDLRRREVWIRAAEVVGLASPNELSFRLGLEDANGLAQWVPSGDVGGLARPFDRSAYDGATKTMLQTLRFPTDCFAAQGERFDLGRIVAILLELPGGDRRPVAFDDLQIVDLQ